MIENKASSQPAVISPLEAADVILDAVVEPAQPGRGLQVTVIDNQDLVDRFEQYVVENGL